MKDCMVELIGGSLNCSRMPDKCVVMANEGVPDGDLDSITQVFKGYSTEILQMYVRAHAPGAYWGDLCKASPVIYRVGTSILKERGESV